MNSMLNIILMKTDLQNIIIKKLNIQILKKNKNKLRIVDIIAAIKILRLKILNKMI